MKVKALITAAGMGKRFGALTRTTNKCLFHVDGKELIVHILDRLREAGVSEAVVVTGYQRSRVERAVGHRARAVFNPFYRVSGILGSFWQARPYLDGKPFVFTTSDHFFHPSVLRDCLRVKSDICITVQRKKSYTREDAKVIIERSKVVRLGKDIPVSSAHGEFGGLTVFSARASRAFFRELEACFDKGDLGGYMMDIMSLVSHKHAMPIRYAFCGEEMRTEVDSVHDLRAARHLSKVFKTGRGPKSRG
ncbi:MAG: hypothetical protein MOGMAGMI_00852 [Candidatus Omnitrophica bacterium]|nr:hypothetical protein [Candidatus Omnitrophota bacterium]